MLLRPVERSSGASLTSLVHQLEAMVGSQVTHAVAVVVAAGAAASSGYS